VDLGGSERLTINRPQTARADLQEAREAAASTATGAGVMGGEATAAIGAGMEMSLGCGSTTDPTVYSRLRSYIPRGGWREDAERVLDLPVVVGVDFGKGRSDRRRRQLAQVCHGRPTPPKNELVPRRN
jgi:hypothetical protein